MGVSVRGCGLIATLTNQTGGEPVAFTVRNLKDLTDIGSKFDGPPDLEFRHASAALDLSSPA